VVARILYAVLVAGDDPLVGDGFEIHAIANVVADGRGYVTPIVPPGVEPVATAHKPPLYPLVLAFFSWLGADSPVAHQVVTALIGGGTVAAVGFLAHRLAGNRAAVVAAAIAAFYPVFLATDSSLRTETLYTFLVTLALLSTYRALERPTPLRFAELGAVIALAALVRTEGLLLLALLALPVAWRAGSPLRWSRLAAAAVVCALVLSPWLIRCWIAFDQPVLISTNSGDLLAGANCEATYGGPLLGGWAFGCLGDGVPGGNEAEVSARLRDRGLEYAGDHVGRLPVVLVARVLRPWGVFRPREQIALRVAGEGQRRDVDWIGLVCFWALTPLAIAGLVLLRRRGQPLFILGIPFLLVVLVSAAGYGVLRFRTPADPALIALAAVALDALIGAGSRRLAPNERTSGATTSRAGRWRRAPGG
jgi:4-amino-4-deoxy-L-arabinose transferase-like glycosyltransferase